MTLNFCSTHLSSVASACPVWASIIMLLLISYRVGTDRSATHKHTHTHPTLRALGKLPTIPDSYPNMHAVSAGSCWQKWSACVRGMALILISCSVLIKWVSPFTHVSRRILYNQIYPTGAEYINPLLNLCRNIFHTLKTHVLKDHWLQGTSLNFFQY